MKHLNVEVNPESFPALPQADSNNVIRNLPELNYNRANILSIYNSTKSNLQMAPELSQLGNHLEAVLKRDGYKALELETKQ